MVTARVDGAEATSEHVELADRVTTAVLAVPGVTGMHGGHHGVTATYLPGRRVVGVRLREDHTEVHITVDSHLPLRPVADEVRRVVQPLVNQPVHVTVEDLTP